MEFPIINLTDDNETIRVLALMLTIKSVGADKWQTAYILERAAAFEQFIVNGSQR